MFPHTVTIYNKIKTGWKRTVVSDCFFDSSHGVTLRKTGAAGADKFQIIFRDLAGYVGDKDFAGEGWTMQTKDIIVLGAVKDEIVKSPSEIMDKYANVAVVTAYDYHDYGGDMSNLEVTGK